MQLEPVELILRAEIACIVRIGANQRGILHLPAGADGVGFKVMPAIEILAIEEQFPAAFLFVVGKEGEWQFEFFYEFLVRFHRVRANAEDQCPFARELVEERGAAVPGRGVTRSSTHTPSSPGGVVRHEKLLASESRSGRLTRGLVALTSPKPASPPHLAL